MKRNQDTREVSDYVIDAVLGRTELTLETAQPGNAFYVEIPKPDETPDPRRVVYIIQEQSTKTDHLGEYVFAKTSAYDCFGGFLGNGFLTLSYPKKRENHDLPIVGKPDPSWKVWKVNRTTAQKWFGKEIAAKLFAPR